MQTLISHPALPRPPIERVEAGIDLIADGGEVCLEFSYRIIVDPAQIVLPARTDAVLDAPVDGLWQHTCCEAFIARIGQSSYREFNFSPNGQWAAYAFADTRRPEAVEALNEQLWRQRPDIVLVACADGFALRARLTQDQLPPGSGPFCAGLSVVLETRPAIPSDDPALRPSCSYWALAHPGALPDFHHRAAFRLCFTIESHSA